MAIPGRDSPGVVHQGPSSSALPAGVEAEARAELRRWRDAAGAVLVTMVIASVGLLTVWLSAREAQFDAVRAELLQIARMTAVRVDGDLHGTFQRAEQENSPEHLRALEPLALTSRSARDIVWVYTAILRDGRIYFVLDGSVLHRPDANTLPPDPIMTENTIDDPALRAALERQQAVAADAPIDDAYYGTLLSAYAPFYTRAGEFAGVVGVDMTLGQYEARMAPVNRSLGLVVVAVLLLSLLAGAMLLRGYRLLRERQVASARNAAILDAIPDTLFEIDLDGRYLDCRAPDASLLGRAPAELIGKRLEDVLSPESAVTCREALAEAAERGVSWGRQVEIEVVKGRRWFELSVSRKASGGVNPGFIALARDITDRKQAESRIFHLAYYDSLTELPNRVSFDQRLQRETERARRRGDRLAVLFLDLDGFKTVNDTMGHAVGDLLLQHFAERLKTGMRPPDFISRNVGRNADIELARLGGDEFTLLIPDLRQAQNVVTIAQRIHDLARQPFALEGHDVIVTASIGIALFPDDGTDAATLLQHAHTAMYHAKSQGRNNWQFYSESMTAQALGRLVLESSLRQAVARQEFHLVYQPQLDAGSGRIGAVEALIRWTHPERGIVPPLEFIPLAEETGQIVPIGEWVMRQACEDAARWGAAGMPITVAVNLSAAQITHSDPVALVESVLADTGLPAHLLEVEVTEGVLMEDLEATREVLARLRRLGVTLALDDFGTGYSSLSYLKRLPLNSIKVDASFVRGLPDDRESLSIVHAIVALARSLDLSLTAEGIETAAQAAVLSGLHCEKLQGYLFSRPVPAAEIPALLERRWDLGPAADGSILDAPTECTP